MAERRSKEPEWKDPRVATALGEAGLSSCRVPLTEVWTPRIAVLNTRGGQRRLPEIAGLSEDGRVSYFQRGYGDLSAALELRDFPFDEQRLPITIVSYTYGPGDVRLIPDQALTARAEHFSIPGWSVDAGTMSSGALRRLTPNQEKALAERGLDSRFSRLDYVFVARRQSTYFVWTVVLPLTLIVIMSWGVFWIDPTRVEVQMGLGATSVLTMIAFLLSVRSSLPPVSYLTRMDVLVLAGLTLVFAALLEALVTCGLAAGGRAEPAKKLDRIARWVFPGTFVIVHIVFWR